MQRYLAKLNVYTSMAHYVAKVLHQRPNDILDTWGVSELIVAFGEYANEEAERAYQEWKGLPTEQRQKIERPSRYMVRFINTNESEE